MLKTATTFVGTFSLSNYDEQITLLQLRKGEGSPQFLLRFEGADLPKLARWSVYGGDESLYAVESVGDWNGPTTVACYYDGATIGLSVNGSEWETAPAPAETWVEPGMVLSVADPANGCSCLSLNVHPRVLDNSEL